MLDIQDDLRDLSFDDMFDININDYLTPDPGLLGQMLPQTPQVNPSLLQSNLQSSISQTGLTPTEEALLLPEEKAIRLRQRGMA